MADQGLLPGSRPTGLHGQHPRCYVKFEHIAASKKSPVWLEIHRENLLHNVGAVKQWAGPGVEVIAVIKANGYGHGLELVASTLGPHVTMFGVTGLQEALRLREYGIETPILFLGPLQEEEIRSAIQSRSVITLSSYKEAKLVESVAAKLGRIALVHLKIDTGMGRLGVAEQDAVSLALRISNQNHLRLEGVYTHFPSADEDERFTRLQIERFHTAVGQLKEKGITIPKTHLSNSAALTLFRAAGGSLVRTGLMLYGALPHALGRYVRTLNLFPVLSWKTKVLYTKELARGQSCGYGRTFTARRKTRIAWLPVGYSHGYPLPLSGRGEVVIRGKRFPVRGRVSMDFTPVEIGLRSPVREGDTVTLLGTEDKAEISLAEFSRWAGTIPYDILTGIHPAIPRISKP